ncbi:hypothetical protein [Peribacillus asahii]|uniref:hypothetical protein n=1 Tax=Peribacillus asahii TaxID=228899 RepID=UPI00207A34DB|nr:hypothetical protein [Peribacillus asahii]USK61357.1 hypothetical protein LIT37_08580 [Peribacillus asahii]
MKENKYMEIPREELLEETKRFKEWSGPVLVKLFTDSEYGLLSLGSGGLLKYRGRYFAITNEHVIRNVDKEKRKSEIIIPYKDKNNKDIKVKIIDDEEDKENDFAALEICETSVKLMKNHWFLDESYMEKNVLDYIDRSNVVFLHGFPWTETNIDTANRIVDMTTLPYTTFVNEYNDYSDILELIADSKGISEFGTEINLPSFAGMSGSLVYGYYRNELIPYKFLGILSYWEAKTNILGVFPISEVINFLDTKFFITD